MSKKMIVKGVGTFMAKRMPTDPKGAVEIITLGTLQDLKITFNTEIDDIFGGDGLFAIDTLVTNKSIEITATDAKFDLNAMELMLGSKEGVREQVSDYVHVLNEKGNIAAGTNGEIGDVGEEEDVVVGRILPKHADTVFSTPDFAIRLNDSNILLKKVAFVDNSEPAIDEFMVEDSTNGIIVNSAHVLKTVILNYKRSETVDIFDVLVDEVPFPVQVVHHGSFLQKDGTYAGIETELYSCLAKGEFSIDAARATASATNISLQVIDPENVDGKMGTVKRFTSNSKS